MDGFKSSKGPWEWARTTDTWLLLIFIMFISPPPFLHMCLVRYPQIPMGSMAAIFGYNPPACATRVVTRSFSTSIPNPWSPLQQLAIKMKSVHHWTLTCFTCLSNPPDVYDFPPSRQRAWKECLFLKHFFHNPHPILLNGEANKT